MTYYALRTAPQKEFALAGRYDDHGDWIMGILQRKGYDVFVPTETKTRRIKAGKGKRITVTYPLFNGYIFVREGFSWMHLLSERLIIGVVGFDGWPASISESEIQRLMRETGSSIPHRRAVNTRKSFMAGDLAEITQGPFAGQIVKVEGLHGKKATIFLNLFGVRKLAEIETDKLEAA